VPMVVCERYGGDMRLYSGVVYFLDNDSEVKYFGQSSFSNLIIRNAYLLSLTFNASYTLLPHNLESKKKPLQEVKTQ